MDLPSCGCVVSYDPPSSFATYLHRVGRTARAGAAGHAYSLLSAGDELTGFHRILRVARRPKMQEEEVWSGQLQPLMEEYELSLQSLRRTLAHHT